MHQHRRLGVPVGLGADVDAGDDHVDLAAALGEPNQAAQDARDPVHVLGTAVHGDARPRRNCEPLDRHLQPLGKVERRENPSALAFRQRA